MSQIRIDLNEMERLNGRLRQVERQLAGISGDVSSMVHQVEGPIRTRHSIGERLEGVQHHLGELQNRLRELRGFVQASGNAYGETEQGLVRQADHIGDKQQPQSVNPMWRDARENPRARPSPEAIRAGYARMGQAAGSAVEWFTRHTELHETKPANMAVCLPTSGSGSDQTGDSAPQNPFMKSLHSFQEIGEDLLHSAQVRSEKALDSPYDFVNYWTLGLSGGWYQGAKLRAEKRWDSAFDFTNWLTSGVAGTIKGAVAPEEPFSKEHWLDSMGAALLLVNGMKVWSEKPNVPVRDGGMPDAGHEETAKAMEGTGKGSSNFADRALLEGHYTKHGGEFKDSYKNADEYLQGANDVINDGTKVQYEYKLKNGMVETRTGYVKFMGNTQKGEAKFEFVSTNNSGNITTYHVKRGEDLWKLLNGNKYDKIINPPE